MFDRDMKKILRDHGWNVISAHGIGDGWEPMNEQLLEHCLKFTKEHEEVLCADILIALIVGPNVTAAGGESFAPSVVRGPDEVAGVAFTERRLPRGVDGILGVIDIVAIVEIGVGAKTCGAVDGIEDAVERELDATIADEGGLKDQGGTELALDTEVEVHGVGVLEARIKGGKDADASGAEDGCRTDRPGDGALIPVLRLLRPR